MPISCDKVRYVFWEAGKFNEHTVVVAVVVLVSVVK